MVLVLFRISPQLSVTSDPTSLFCERIWEWDTFWRQLLEPSWGLSPRSQYVVNRYYCTVTYSKSLIFPISARFHFVFLGFTHYCGRVDLEILRQGLEEGLARGLEIWEIIIWEYGTTDVAMSSAMLSSTAIFECNEFNESTYYTQYHILRWEVYGI